MEVVETSKKMPERCLQARSGHSMQPFELIQTTSSHQAVRAATRSGSASHSGLLFHTHDRCAKASPFPSKLILVELPPDRALLVFFLPGSDALSCLFVMEPKTASCLDPNLLTICRAGRL